MTKPHSGHLAFIPASDIAALLAERGVIEHDGGDA